MDVHTFDIDVGFYAFTTEALDTNLHTHPVAELVLARQGTFKLDRDSFEVDGLRGVYLPPNTPHRITTGEDARIDIFMFEQPSGIEGGFGEVEHLPGDHGILVFSEKNIDQLTSALLLKHHLRPARKSYDDRVLHCRKLIDAGFADAALTVSLLAQEVHLSESRLAHLFREDFGLSPGKYVGWARLRAAISNYLEGDVSLGDAALTAGFFDAAHFSRTFRKMLGEKPSFAYNNSSTVQE